MMLVKELLSKVMCIWGKIHFIGKCVDISSRSISTVNFKGFRFSKVYKMFGVCD